MTDTAQPAPAAPEQHTLMQRMLDGIERLGNKMPDPAILFLWPCLGAILLSQVLSWADVKATYAGRNRRSLPGRSANAQDTAPVPSVTRTMPTRREANDD